MSLARECHQRSHAGHAPRRWRLLIIAARREQTRPKAIRDKIQRIRRNTKCKVWKIDDTTPQRTVKPATGTARFDKETNRLTITTNVQQGKKMVKHTVVYTVEDVRPDPRVADPAFSLAKDDGEVYHVAVDEWGPHCSCPQATFRGANSKEVCKHCKAMMAVGLIPKS